MPTGKGYLVSLNKSCDKTADINRKTKIKSAVIMKINKLPEKMVNLRCKSRACPVEGEI